MKEAIKANLNISPLHELKKQLESGEYKVNKSDGRTIEDYLLVNPITHDRELPRTVYGYEVLELTEDEENIIFKLGNKIYDWQPHSFNWKYKSL